MRQEIAANVGRQHRHCYKAEKDIDAITSSAILHLSVTDKEVLPDYLALVLNSRAVKMQAERDAGGSIILHWKPDEIRQVIVPLLPSELQGRISALVRRSFALREESRRLLDEARRMVEGAIEG